MFFLLIRLFGSVSFFIVGSELHFFFLPLLNVEFKIPFTIVYIRNALIIIYNRCFHFFFHKSNIIVYTSFCNTEFSRQLLRASGHLIYNEIINSYDYSNIQFCAIIFFDTETEIQYPDLI